MKRVWKTADFAEHDGEFVVRLDGKALRLPGGGVLKVPFQALAASIAAEWDCAGENFAPDDLPLTRLAATARERVPAHRTEIVDQLSAYGMNDVLCYRAGDTPTLAALEETARQPWVDWAASRFGVQLVVGTGIMPVTQAPETAALFKAALAVLTDYELAALGVIVPALGSLVLGLAVAAGALAAEDACEIAQLDEVFQAERWGADAAAAARRQAVREDVAVSTRFMVLCRP